MQVILPVAVAEWVCARGKTHHLDRLGNVWSGDDTSKAGVRCRGVDKTMPGIARLLISEVADPPVTGRACVRQNGHGPEHRVRYCGRIHLNLMKASRAKVGPAASRTT